MNARIKAASLVGYASFALFAFLACTGIYLLIQGNVNQGMPLMYFATIMAYLAIFAAAVVWITRRQQEAAKMTVLR